VRRPSPALVIALIALFFSLAGTGWAVTQLPPNSVGTPQLKANAVTGPKVKDGSLSTADFAAGTLRTGATGPAGPQGERGPRGEQGIQGEQGVQGLQGERGLRGEQGIRGEQGAQGLQGVLATAAVTQKTWQGVDAAGTTIASTSPSQAPSGSCTDSCRVATGPIVVTQPSRIIASAQVKIRNIDTTFYMQRPAACYLILDAGGSFSNFTYWANATTDILDVWGKEQMLSMTGAADVSAGTYDIGVRCGDAIGPGPTQIFEADDITVTAFAVAR